METYGLGRTFRPLRAEAWEDTQRTLTPHLEGRPEVVLVFLYGSAAAGRPFRDLDLGVVVDRDLVTPTDDTNIAVELAGELSPASNTP